MYSYYDNVFMTAFDCVIECYNDIINMMNATIIGTSAAV